MNSRIVAAAASVRVSRNSPLPLKQPHSPVLLQAVNTHLATFKKYVPPMPMQ